MLRPNCLQLSALAVPIENYIAEKRAVGYKFDKGADMLRSFGSFVYSRGTGIISDGLDLFRQARHHPYGVRNQAGIGGVVDVGLDHGGVHPHFGTALYDLFLRCLADQVLVQLGHMVAPVGVQPPPDL